MLASRVRRFLVSEDGPTSVEHGVMLFLVLVFFAGVVASLHV